MTKPEDVTGQVTEGLKARIAQCLDDGFRLPLSIVTVSADGFMSMSIFEKEGGPPSLPVAEYGNTDEMHFPINFTIIDYGGANALQFCICLEDDPTTWHALH
jgi:hypothetical protein